MTAPDTTTALQLTTLPLTADDVDRCGPIWGDRGMYTTAEFSELLARVRWLLSTGRALGSMFVEPDGRVRGYGVSTFVREDLIASFLSAPHAQLGRRILLDEDLAAVTLDERAVGHRNATTGLELVVLSQGFDLEGLAPDTGWQPVAGTSAQAFVDDHRGFKLARIVNEIFGAAGIAFLDRVRPATIQRFALTTLDGEPLEGGCWILSREEAERDGGLILPLFTYQTPTIRFTSTERQVLRTAMSGVRDEDIARSLGVTLSTVKARWRRIQERAMHHPRLRQQIETARRERHRGPQWRHFIIEYVRSHPSELTPYYSE